MKLDLTPAQVKLLRKLVKDEEMFLENRGMDTSRDRRELAEIREILNEIEFQLERSEPHAVA